MKERLVDRNLCWIPISLPEECPCARVQDKMRYLSEEEKKILLTEIWQSKFEGQRK